jgi:D-amino-acid dehydrogenase
VPLEAERGYHLMLSHPGITRQQTILFEDEHIAATPVNTGIRLAGTVEFARTDDPPNYQISDILFTHALRYLPEIKRDGATPWMGSRPSLPDSLPIINSVPGRPGLFCAFGHERRGLTQAAITATCIVNLVQGRESAVDLRPFALGRF